MSRYIDADALITELQKDEELFDKEAEDCRKNSRNYTDCYMQAMRSRADGIRDAIIEVFDAPSIDIVRCKCDFGKCHEQGDTLYESSDWDGGIGFDYIRDIKYCPLCGGLLDGEEQTEVCIRPDQDCKACWKNQICEIRDKEERDRIHKLINDRKSNGKE